MPFASIFIPDFPVQALLRAEPTMREQPLAVLTGRAPLERVFAVNEAARAQGAQAGMTRVQIESFPAMHVRARSLGAEQEAREAVFACAYQFSPRVEDTSGLQPGDGDTCVLVLDAAGLDSLFGSPGMIAKAIRKRTRELGLEAHVGFASNPDAAVYAARARAGANVIAPGQEAQFLRSMPVSLLDAAEEVQETFQLWGIHTLGQLAGLPEVELIERLGQEGRRLQALARGAYCRPLVPLDELQTYEEEAEPEYPIELLEALLLVIHAQLEKLEAKLAARALSVAEVHVSLELETPRNSPLPAHERSICLPTPMNHVPTLMKLLQLDLAAHPPPAPVEKVRVRLGATRPRRIQAGLFAPKSPEPEKLEVTLARIQAMVGEGNAGSPKLVDSHKPQAFEVVKFVAGEGRSRLMSERTAQVHGAMRAFRPPLRARVEVANGAPVRVWSEQVRGSVTAAAGPWRSSGAWWSAEGWAQEEWEVALTPKMGSDALEHEAALGIYRLCHDMRSGAWFVSGEYD